MNWKKVKLKEVVNNLDSKRRPLNDAERSKINSKGLYPYIGANNIMGHVDEYLFDETILCIAEDGGSWGAGQKCAVIYSGKTWVNNHAHVVTAKNSLDIRFLMYYLNFADLNKHISGSTRGKLTKSSLEDIDVPLPPKRVQVQIADTLDKADTLRRKDQEFLAKYDELAQSVFYEMFGDPVENTKNWETGKLIDNVIIKGGGTPKTTEDKYYGGEIPWISPKDMKTTFVSNSIDKITELAIAESSTNLIDPFCVLMVVRSGILKNSLPLAINTVPVALNQDMKSFKCLNKLNPYYLLYFLKSYSPYLLESVRGTTADNLSSDVLKKIIIQIPPFNKQSIFEKYIKNIFQEKQILSKASLCSQNLFEAISDKYFNEKHLLRNESSPSF